jgi:hypothetical protein
VNLLVSDPRADREGTTFGSNPVPRIELRLPLRSRHRHDSRNREECGEDTADEQNENKMALHGGNPPPSEETK